VKREKRLGIEKMSTPPVRPTVTLEILTPTDYANISDIKTLAFADKCAENDQGRSYEHLAKKYPAKEQHCRVAWIYDDSIGNRVIAGAIQLQLGQDPGDLDFPSFLRHEIEPHEAYIEFIAAHPSHQGIGVGSVMLEWAESFARSFQCRVLSLDVMKRNEGAVRLYQRKGFEIQSNPVGSYCCASIFCCIISCGKYFDIYYMVRKIDT
jgi:ribosomal protein S18 acetylase RimI-like enzyme